MAKKKSQSSLFRSQKTPDGSVGIRLRHQRVDVIGISLRSMAERLEISPIHLSDIETGKRIPSDDLLMQLAQEYRIPEADLRAGFTRPDTIVGEVASESPIAAEKVPQFLRTARGLNRAAWDKLIQHARDLSSSPPHASDSSSSSSPRNAKTKESGAS